MEGPGRYGRLAVAAFQSLTVQDEEARAMDTVIKELGLKTTGNTPGFVTAVSWPAYHW